MGGFLVKGERRYVIRFHYVYHRLQYDNGGDLKAVNWKYEPCLL